MSSPGKEPTHSSPSPVSEDGDTGHFPSRAGRRMGPPPSREELELVRDGDSEALGRFFDRYFPHIYGLVFRLLGDVAKAEDMTQDVFIKIQRAIHRIDPERDPEPWLTTIAYNRCRDHWRSAANRMSKQSTSLDEFPEFANLLPGSGANPEEHALAKERERLVQGAIAELPDPQREVLVLHDYQGLTHEEIAAIVGASHAAVRKRYSRALAALAEILQERMP